MWVTTYKTNTKFISRITPALELKTKLSNEIIRQTQNSPLKHKRNHHQSDDEKQKHPKLLKQKSHLRDGCLITWRHIWFKYWGKMWQFYHRALGTELRMQSIRWPIGNFIVLSHLAFLNVTASSNTTEYHIHAREYAFCPKATPHQMSVPSLTEPPQPFRLFGGDIVVTRTQAPTHRFGL